MVYTPTMPPTKESIKHYGGSPMSGIPVPAVPVIPPKPAIADTGHQIIPAVPPSVRQRPQTEAAKLASEGELSVGTVPATPRGVRLIEWRLNEPPVAIETCAVVLDPALFSQSTLEQLRVALENPKWWVGSSIPRLIYQLRQVGVVVALNANEDL